VVRNAITIDVVDRAALPDTSLPSVSKGEPPPLSIMSVCELLCAPEVAVGLWVGVFIMIALLELEEASGAAITVVVVRAEDVIEDAGAVLEVVIEVLDDAEEAVDWALEAEVVAG